MKTNLSFLTVLAIITLTVGTPTRKLTTEINPGCQWCAQRHNMSSVNLVYTKAEGSEDTIHYIWSTVGAPASLIFLTIPSSKMHIDWNKTLSENRTDMTGAISFDPKPIYASAIIVSKLIEFDDENNNGVLDQNTTATITSMDTLTWDAVNDTILTSTTHGHAIFSTITFSNDTAVGEGYISLQFDSTGLEEEHDDIFPKLLRNSNSSQLRIKLNNLPANYNNSRYALEITILNSENTQGPYKVNEQDTINDEYTPGVFKSVQITSNKSQEGFGTFLTWKPIAYTSDELTVTDTTIVNFQPFESEEFENIPISIANAYFNNVIVRRFTTTFGTSGDGFYNKYHQLAWTLVFGIGTPVNEKFSMLVILTVAFGSGIPILLLILSFVYICRLNYKKKQATD